MPRPLQITWRNVESSAALEARIRELAGRLEKFSSQLLHCHVTVEVPHRHTHQGRLYHVHIQLAVPGAMLVVQREGSERPAHENAYVAVRDAFRAVRRQLEDYERSRRLDVKRHSLEGSFAEESDREGSRQAGSPPSGASP